MKWFKRIVNDTNKIKTMDSDLKILIIADTHNTLTEEEMALLNNLSYDLCFLLGDIPQRDMYLICSSMKTPIYGIPGNHDTDTQYDKWLVHNIHGEIINFRGVTFAGWKGSIKYKETPCCVMTDEESIIFAKTLPLADVLLSHDSPKNLHDKKFAHSGLQGITEYLKENSVPINIHGHHHVNTKDILKNGTMSICVYRCSLIDLSSNDVTFIF